MPPTTGVEQRANLAREYRTYTVAPIQLRDSNDNAPRFTGDASMVDVPYTVRDAFGEFKETMVRGAFDKTLADRADVRLLVNHTGVPLARSKSGTLALSATPHLHAEAPLDPSNPTVQEVRSAMRRGDLDQMSIGFRAVRDEWNADYTERRVLEAALFDVSIVTDPASPTTSASLRASYVGSASTAVDNSMGQSDTASIGGVAQTTPPAHLVSGYVWGTTSPNVTATPGFAGVTTQGASSVIGQVADPNTGVTGYPTNGTQVGGTAGFTGTTGLGVTTDAPAQGNMPGSDGSAGDNDHSEDLNITIGQLHAAVAGGHVSAANAQKLIGVLLGGAGYPGSPGDTHGLDPNRFARRLAKIRSLRATPVAMQAAGVDPAPLLQRLDMVIDQADSILDALLAAFGLADADDSNAMAATGPGAMPGSQMLANYADLEYALLQRRVG